MWKLSWRLKSGAQQISRKFERIKKNVFEIIMIAEGWRARSVDVGKSLLTECQSKWGSSRKMARVALMSVSRYKHQSKSKWGSSREMARVVFTLLIKFHIVFFWILTVLCVFRPILANLCVSNNNTGNVSTQN